MGHSWGNFLCVWCSCHTQSSAFAPAFSFLATIGAHVPILPPALYCFCAPRRRLTLTSWQHLCRPTWEGCRAAAVNRGSQCSTSSLHHCFSMSPVLLCLIETTSTSVSHGAWQLPLLLSNSTLPMRKPARFEEGGQQLSRVRHASAELLVILYSFGHANMDRRDLYSSHHLPLKSLTYIYCFFRRCASHFHLVVSFNPPNIPLRYFISIPILQASKWRFGRIVSI